MLSTVLNPECITTLGLASSHSARRYFGNLFWFLFLRLLRCFSSAGLPLYTYFIQYSVSEYCSDGFPHSEIHGLTDICSSPWLIAACHVLLRLLMPRHSSYALLSLTSSKLALFASLCLAANLALSVGFSSSKKTSVFLDSSASFYSAVLGFAQYYDLSFSCFYYVSKLLLVSLDTFAFSFKHLCYPFSIWKNLFTNLLFSYSFFCIQFSNNSFKHLCDVWKVNSDKRLFISHSDLIDR